MSYNEMKSKTSMMYINDISKMFFARMRKHSEEIGVPSGYRRILFDLAHHDGSTQLELARLSHVTPPTVSVTLQKMELDGLIRRESDRDDQRQIRVFLTEKGWDIERSNIDIAIETETVAFSCLSEEENERLRSFLVRIYDNVCENFGCSDSCRKGDNK